MRALLFILTSLLVATAVNARPRALTVRGAWGAFEKARPRNCYAIARPYHSPRPRAWRPFASVGYWPRRDVAGQVHFKLSRAKRTGSAVLLRIDGQTFQLLAGSTDAWATDAAADALIVAAMRGGVEMSIQTRAPNGALIRDSYRLQGAATAIDAAALACAS